MIYKSGDLENEDMKVITSKYLREVFIFFKKEFKMKNNVFLIDENDCKIPIKIKQVVESDLFPVKFVYCAKGYSKLMFSERKSKIVK
jgi:hypothetical protein